MINERDLILRWKQAKEAKEEAEAVLDNAKAELKKTTQEVVEYFEDTGQNSTAKFDGLGRLQANKPRLYASCNNANQDQLFDWLKKQERDDLIKENVHPGTLSSFVAECIENGVEIPDFISYYFDPQLRLY